MAKLTKEHNLSVKNPELAKEWHPTRNGDLTPYDVTPNSPRNVWWQCSKNKDHVWVATIVNRNRGNGCPYCSGKKACKEHNLSVKNLELAKEWHPTKNGDLTPYNVTPGSDKKVWWQCKKKQEHEWEALIYSRNSGRGCPFCSGKKVGKDNNLAVKNPELADEWHPTKNEDLSPYDVTPGSNKKVWWMCHKGHEWKIAPNDRKRGNNCPFCSGKKVGKDNNLAVKNPEWVSLYV